MKDWDIENPPDKNRTLAVFVAALLIGMALFALHRTRFREIGGYRMVGAVAEANVRPASPNTASPAPAGVYSTNASGKAQLKDSKERTREVQRLLAGQGFYKGRIDGKAGPLTRKAVRDFQTSRRLQPDGVVGPKTWKALTKLGH